MLKRKVSIIGHFQTDCDVADGQSVKTRIVTQELERDLGADSVQRIDTYGWKKHPFILAWRCAKAVWGSDNVIFLTDEGGIKVFPSMLQVLNLFGKCRIHYYVVGGWLSRYLDRSRFATRILKRLDAIYVEIPAMLRELEMRGFENGVLVNKFRRMKPVTETEINTAIDKPFRLCFFSRVMREKGIEEAVKAVILANAKAGCEKYSLDIFGTVDPEYKERFRVLLEQSPQCIRYLGVVDYEKSSAVLSAYQAMLFLTFYSSEGYPNVVVDAFAAGLPVIATRWQYNGDIIHEHEDGMLVDVGNIDQVVEVLDKMTAEAEQYAAMRKNACARCSEYLPENAIRKVIEHLK